MVYAVIWFLVVSGFAIYCAVGLFKSDNKVEFAVHLLALLLTLLLLYLEVKNLRHHQKSPEKEQTLKVLHETPDTRGSSNESIIKSKDPQKNEVPKRRL